MKSELQNNIDRLESANWREREMAAQVLGDLGHLEAAKPLLQAIKDDQEEVRANVVAALSHFKSREVSLALIQALKDQSSSVRTEVVYGLGKLGEAQAVESLGNILNSKDEMQNIRWLAADVLGRIGDQRAVGPLLKALQDEKAEVRDGAAHTLGLLAKDEKVLPFLEPLQSNDTAETSVEDNDLGRKIQVKDTAAKAIETIKQRSTYKKVS